MTDTVRDMHALVIINLDVLKAIATQSDAPNKQYKTEAYQRAIDNIKSNIIQSKKNPYQNVAGKSIQDRIDWVLKYGRNIDEVSEYLNEKDSLDDEEEEGYEEEAEINQFVVKEDLSKRKIHKICNIMKSLNTIESMVFNLNLKNELVTNILCDLNKMKEECREELFC
tara:strand:- start:53 stop:556 length:504 start_codon:yes stop_codon:yes gene_type:complete